MKCAKNGLEGCSLWVGAVVCEQVTIVERQADVDDAYSGHELDW